MPVKVVAAVEGGGTSFVCVVVELRGTTPAIIQRQEVSSEDPTACLAACAAFFRQHKPEGGYNALGVATFGPVGLPEHTRWYGHILPTSPKAAWRGVDVLKPLREACQGDLYPLRVRIETDVNAPAWAEYLESGERSTAYVTVGTGVGVGLVVNGQTVHGRMHPEGGHVAVQPLDDWGGYSWGAKAPYRGQNTVEGLASSVALAERAGVSREELKDLPDSHEIWDHAANALANLCVTLVLTLSIETIVLGGGLMQRRVLLPKIQARTAELMNSYVELPVDMNDLIRTSRHGADAGLMGAIILAQSAADASDNTDDGTVKEMKRTAFGHGLWHGMIVGAVGTALVAKLLWTRSHRR